MNSLDLRIRAELIFKIATGYFPDRIIPSDMRKIDQIEEELKEFQRQVGLWVVNNG